MKMETKPPVRIHFRLSRRAGIVVAVAEGASVAPSSAREFTDGFCELSAALAALEPPAGPPPPPCCDAEGMGAVPETLISTGAMPAPEICTVGGAAIIRRALE